MSKSTKRKSTTNNQSKLAKEVKLFNAKRARIIKKNPNAVEYLPPKQSTKQLRTLIGNRNDERRIIRSLEAFRKADAEAMQVTKSGVKTTKWQINELKKQTRLLNKKRAQKLAELEVNRKNLPYHTDRLEVLALKPRKVTAYDYKRKADWDKFIELTMEEVSGNFDKIVAERYKQNYLIALEGEFTFPDLDVSRLKGIIEQLPAEKFIEAYKSDPRLELKFMYGALEQMEKFEYVVSAWEEILNSEE